MLPWKDEWMGRAEAGETSNDVTSGCWKRSQAQCWNRSWGLQDTSLVVRRWGGHGFQGGAGMLAVEKYFINSIDLLFNKGRS